MLLGPVALNKVERHVRQRVDLLVVPHDQQVVVGEAVRQARSTGCDHEEHECQARGGSQCVYEVSWDEKEALRARDPEERVTALEQQLVGMTERLESVYATAADLIAETEIDSVLARITERAATAVRAPRYLLAVRLPSGELECHQRGFAAGEARALAEDVIERPDADFPSSWLVAPVRSGLNDYGVLVALYDVEGHFFSRERQLFELYARYAASALDRATALEEARRHHTEADVLLGLARSLAAAGTTEELAGRVADAVPAVVDCDRVSVFVWNEDEAALECRALFGQGVREAVWMRNLRIRPSDTPALERMIATRDPAPAFVDPDSTDPFLAGVMRQLGSAALVAVPIVAQATFLGVLVVSVTARPDRMRSSPEQNVCCRNCATEKSSVGWGTVHRCPIPCRSSGAPRESPMRFSRSVTATWASPPQHRRGKSSPTSSPAASRTSTSQRLRPSVFRRSRRCSGRVHGCSTAVGRGGGWRLYHASPLIG